ncbi:MAG: hypothetical protein WAT36_05940 [Chromatiaceae bacterium]
MVAARDDRQVRPPPLQSLGNPVGVHDPRRLAGYSDDIRGVVEDFLDGTRNIELQRLRIQNRYGIPLGAQLGGDIAETDGSRHAAEFGEEAIELLDPHRRIQ